ncbi:MAG: hypothetical protein LBH28_00335 [Oscillospiraceae bacterium]|jgi:hypothetical protein|nr:hypothetical protein [Oscillospiraceae bacterium]
MIQKQDLFNRYSEIFVPSFIIHPDETPEGFCVTLTEDDSTAKLRRLIVKNVPSNTILIPLHEYSHLGIGNKLKAILRDDPGIFMCCDYLLAAMTKDYAYFVFIELKSNRINLSDVKKQFKGASCMAEYFNAIGAHFYNLRKSELSAFELRYVLISVSKLNKRPTKRASSAKYSTPDEFFHHKVAVENHEASVPLGLLLS